jgi:hypothetical protein
MHRTIRTAIATAFALLALSPSCPAPARAAPVVLHHELHVTLDPEQGLLEGVDRLTLAPAGASEVHLHLAPAAEIDSVTLDGKPLPFVRMSGRLAVPIPGEPRAEVTLRVSYRGVFRDPVPQDPVNADDPTYGVAAVILPQGCFLSGAAGWYPDVPANAATFHVRVEAPQGYVAVTSGQLLEREEKEERSISVWETATPLASLTLAAGPWQVNEEREGRIPVFTYFYPQSQQLAETYLRATRRYLGLYRELFGPYPFEKFAVVENFFPTGYGFPSWTLLGSTVVRLPFIVETSLGHEIAHSWWGNGVRIDAGGNWSEGLTTYVADHLYKDRLSAEEGREYRLKLLRDYAALVPPGSDYPLRSFVGRRSPLDQAIGYGKGAMVFHMARRLIGENAFWEGLREVAATRMHREAGWRDFAAAMGKAAGRDLNGFFGQWVERPGAPVLRLTKVLVERLDDRWRVSGLLLQEGEIYDLAVPLRLETEGRSVSEVIAAGAAETPFVFDVPDRPLRLAADPDVDLFRRLDPAEIPPTVNAVRGSPDLLVVAAAGLPAETLEAAKTLLAALGRESAPVVAEGSLTAAQLQGRDLLLLGLPSRPGLLPPLPKEVEVAASAYALFGNGFADPGDALFLALPHPSDRGRVAALFLPLSAEAAREAARKIPHYGKYGYLGFHHGENRAKGSWAVAGSPVVHDFTAMEEHP